MRHGSFLIISIGLLLVLLSAVSSSAEYFDYGPQEVVDGASRKLVRGVANTATGWIEFPKQIVVTFNEEGAVRGIFEGPLRGIGMTLVRTLSGVAEVATFIIPVPENYQPYYEPEFVWEK